MVSLTIFATAAHLMLLSPHGHRESNQIHRIVRHKAHVQGAMASIVEWLSLRMQDYRYGLLTYIARFFALFGIHRPTRSEPPAVAGDYDHALHVDYPGAPSFLDQ